MTLMKYPSHLMKLIEVLKRLPGVGNKSAERFAFEMLEWPENRLQELSVVIQQIPHYLQKCSECGCLKGNEACGFCHERRQESKALCVVASARDVFAIEETREYKGLYHVLGGVLSPMDGINPASLTLPKLKERINKHAIQEVVIALDSTLEGDATALYLKNELQRYNMNISRLAFGLPMGSSLDYVDGGTLARALAARGQF